MSLEKSLDDIINDRRKSRNSQTSDWISRRRFFKNKRLAPYYKVKGVYCTCISVSYACRHVLGGFLALHLIISNPISFYKRNYDEPWIHDLYEGLTEKPVGRVSKQQYQPPSKVISYRVRIENLHYELTEDDLNIGPVVKLSIKYDRSGRSTGVAYVNFEKIEDAHNAINQFNGQPITLTLDLQPPRKSQKETGSLISRISNFKIKKEKGKYKTREDLDNELDKYMNVTVQSKDIEKPMIIDQK
ncbi:hypothetical protein PMAC_003284 [Pneumocystis sp. 'macacae']|nr:hypothetical protein PMAC_003284 [Pneumocystis sp. 'macacae']